MLGDGKKICKKCKAERKRFLTNENIQDGVDDIDCYCQDCGCKVSCCPSCVSVNGLINCIDCAVYKLKWGSEALNIIKVHGD
jgi:hypothetical protein